jgi:hypothetical protein
MVKILRFLKTRIIDHWQTTLVAVLILVGYHWVNIERISFSEFQEYIVIIGSVVLRKMEASKRKKLIAKGWKIGTVEEFLNSKK